MGITSNQQSAQDFLSTTGVSTPLILLDSQFRVSGHYGVSGTPTWMLFNSNGDQLARGSRIDSSLDQAVAAAIAG
jgi:hypothetical protein